MELAPFSQWLNTTPLWLIALLLFALMTAAATIGFFLRRTSERRADGKSDGSDLEGYIVSAALGLLALLLGFTFSLAIDRFDARRRLVLEEANAIGTTYLRTQLLEAPHRARISNLLVVYTDNRIALAKADTRERAATLLTKDDRLITDLWRATVAAFPTMRGYDFSSEYLESMNNLIDLNAAREVSRMARVPPQVFGVLFVYVITTAGLLGYVVVNQRGRRAGVFLFLLLTLALTLIIDIDRPVTGRIKESQAPMELLRESLRQQTPAVFDEPFPETTPPPPSAAGKP